MDKREKMLALVDPAHTSGLEIGPLDIPIVTREMGRVRYVDHVSTEELRVKNRENPFVDVDRIVEVDYVWGTKTLPELVASESPFDYVVASHVIEHVPDLVGWLEEVRAVLRPRGVLSLAVPDKQYCFDYFRQPTGAAEVLEAYLRHDRKPGFRQLFDHLASFATVDGKLIWDANARVAPTRQIPVRTAWDIARAQAADGVYHDVHSWVFTPISFFDLLATLTELDLIDFIVAKFFPTAGHEFFVSLQALDRSDDRETQRAAQLESLPLRSSSAAQANGGRWRERTSPQRSHLLWLRRVLRRVKSSGGV